MAQPEYSGSTAGESTLLLDTTNRLQRYQTFCTEALEYVAQRPAVSFGQAVFDYLNHEFPEGEIIAYLIWGTEADPYYDGSVERQRKFFGAVHHQIVDCGR